MIGKDLNSLKQLTSSENHNCFGCSPSNIHGLHMKFYADTDRVYSKLSVPGHLCGWDTLVHGGVIATICDEIMSWSVLYLLRKIVLTKSITIDFTRPITVGEDLLAIGFTDKKNSEREALMRGELYNSRDELCAVSHGLFALFDIDVLKEKKLISDDMIHSFQNIMKSFE